MKTLTIVAGVMLVFVFVWERVDVVRLGLKGMLHCRLAIDRIIPRTPETLHLFPSSPEEYL